jgi:hypothetical protein
VLAVDERAAWSHARASAATRTRLPQPLAEQAVARSI